MKPAVMLTIASLLSILLLTLHITDDIVRGISKAEPSNIALITLAVFLYGTLMLAERRSGYVIMLLVGLFAAGMPVIHMRGPITARSPSPPAASSSSGHSGHSARSGASPSSSRRADCGTYRGAGRGSARTRNAGGGPTRYPLPVPRQCEMRPLACSEGSLDRMHPSISRARSHDEFSPKSCGLSDVRRRRGTRLPVR